MKNLLVDERDQKFVLHEMLNIGQLSETSLYGHISREVIDAALDATLALAVKESYPAMAEADREGCRLENGNVRSPRCYHRLKDLYDRGGWSPAYIPQEYGGSGFPLSLWTPLFEPFVHNYPFLWVWASPFSGTGFIVHFGSEDQKRKYLPHLASGRWGSALAFTEEQAGSDIALQRAVAVRQPDGSYRIKGNKPAVTTGDSDMFENMLQLVCARVEGDPANANGLSLFIVPKYLVNRDGSLGARNDYAVVGIERTLGLRGSPTVSINFGEHGNCHGEILGERGLGLAMAVSTLQRSPYYGILATGIASAAYLHSVEHAKNRIQGAHVSEAADPDARRVPIIAHPHVRQLLLWMKSHVEGMRAVVYYSCLCLDKANALSDPGEREKWAGLLTVLFPVFRRYAGTTGFKVTEAAIQVHGRYGFFSDYPVQQFIRDIIPLSWWELDGGQFTLLYITQMMGQRDGRDFSNLVAEMNRTLKEFGEIDSLRDLAGEVQSRVNLLREMGLYFVNCFKNEKALVPISNGAQIIDFIGDICLAWLLFWQAGIATRRLDAIYGEHRIDPRDPEALSSFLNRNEDAAFYHGKVHGARYFIKNVLPQADALAAAIRSEDLSVMSIHEAGF
jgi:alkylation response protein AidB-like acyl-CoA dehydrogenase